MTIVNKYKKRTVLGDTVKIIGCFRGSDIYISSYSDHVFKTGIVIMLNNDNTYAGIKTENGDNDWSYPAYSFSVRNEPVLLSSDIRKGSKYKILNSPIDFRLLNYKHCTYINIFGRPTRYNYSVIENILPALYTQDTIGLASGNKLRINDTVIVKDIFVMNEKMGDILVYCYVPNSDYHCIIPYTCIYSPEPSYSPKKLIYD